MRYIIMCGGNYKHWEIPRQMSNVLGEEIVARTIRLLKENGIKDISISTTNPLFEKYGVPILKHNNLYETFNWTVEQGDWLNCFYPTEEPVCYIFGDVYFSPEAIKTIVETETDDIEFFGSKSPFDKRYIKNHMEPFALKVVNQKHLREAIKKTREYEKEGKFWRKPIMWELWEVIKDAPFHQKGTPYDIEYTIIRDYTCDVDWQEDVNKLNLKLFNDYKYKLSIIIAYYKTYDYVTKILDTLIPQLNKDVEVILVDDGCNEKRLDKYKEINIIHLKENKGGASAMNVGIMNSKGKYIGFIDSDDMISDDYVDTLLNKINTCDADTIFMDWQDMETKEIHKRPDNYAQWKCIYKRTIIPLFNEGRKYSFDVPFYDELNSKEYTKEYVDKVLYFYNSGNPDNLTHQKAEYIKKQDQERRKNMVKVEVTEEFTLERFNELKDIQRISREQAGRLYVGDTFYCEKDIAEYLTGGNAKNKTVVKVLEVEPKKEIEPDIKIEVKEQAKPKKKKSKK